MDARHWIRRHRREVLLFAVIMLIGTGLRLYDVGGLMHFGGDESRDAYVIRSIARDGDIQLLGPIVSPGDQAFHLGPFYYYLLVPGYWLAGNSPAGGAWTIALFSAASIALLYFLVRRWWGGIAALAAILLYSVSWLVVYYGRWAWNPNVVPFFIMGVFICLYYLAESPAKHKKWWLYGLAVLVALITQLHGTALYVLPPLLALYFIIFRPRIIWYAYVVAIGIMLLLYAPLLLYEAQNSFANSQGFWHVLTSSEGNGESLTERLSHTYTIFIDFYHESLLHRTLPLVFYGVLLSSLLVLGGRLTTAIRTKKKDTAAILLGLWVVVPLVVFVFYSGAVPPHYFSLVFPLPFILVGGLCAWLWRRRWWRVGTVAISFALAGILIFHTIVFFADLQPDGSRATTYEITLSELEQVVDYIITDSAGEPFNFMVYPEGYRNSFQYLFDQQSVQPSVVPNDTTYAAIWGRQPLVPNFVESADIVGTKLFGALTVIKTNPHR